MQITTKELEHIAYQNLKKMGTYLCYEVMIPHDNHSQHNERVDLLTYETKGIWRFYELKVSKSDFNSKCKLSWYGHFNYYILPLELYNQVKDQIPKGIGVYVANDSGTFWCIKKPKRRELQIDHDLLMLSFMQGLSREYAKYRKILKNKDKRKKVK